MTARDQGDGDGDGGGFLNRWSRLKSEDKPAAEPEIVDGIADQNAVAKAEDATPPEPEEAELDEAAIAELPDIETLDKDSDYTGFMRAGVPEALRQRALRKLWLSDPVLANLDGLNDYDDDFGAIYREGVAYMKRLADAGERMTRPGEEEEMPEPGDTEDDSEQIVDADPAAEPPEPPEPPKEPDDGNSQGSV